MTIMIWPVSAAPQPCLPERPISMRWLILRYRLIFPNLNVFLNIFDGTQPTENIKNLLSYKDKRIVINSRRQPETQ